MHGGFKALIGVAGLALVLGMAALVLLIYLRLSGAYGNYRMPSRGMAPTIEKGDSLLGLATGISLGELHQGDVVVFRMIHLPDRPDYEGLIFVQRIAALQGQHVQLEEGKVIVDGTEFTVTNEFGTHRYADMGSYEKDFIVPGGHVHTLGDNTENSLDGRYWGCLPADRIVKRAVRRYWPPARAGIIR
jgi:signal peptidase I